MTRIVFVTIAKVTVVVTVVVTAPQPEFFDGAKLPEATAKRARQGHGRRPLGAMRDAFECRTRYRFLIHPHPVSE